MADGKAAAFTAQEKAWLTRNPDVLRALANHHDAADAEASAISPEWDNNPHPARAAELRKLADEIEGEW